MKMALQKRLWTSLNDTNDLEPCLSIQVIFSLHVIEDYLAGVVIFETPLAYSTMLGPNTKDTERLISRGASASWTPRNLGSKLLSYAIDWCVQNTPYVFSMGILIL